MKAMRKHSSLGSGYNGRNVYTDTRQSSTSHPLPTREVARPLFAPLWHQRQPRISGFHPTP